MLNLFNFSLLSWTIILFSSFISSIIIFFSFKSSIKKAFKFLTFFAVQLSFFVIFSFAFTYNILLHFLFLSISLIIVFLFYLFNPNKESSKKKKLDPFYSIPFPLANGSDVYIENVRRGVIIFGSAGSGKTESTFVPMLKHSGKMGIPVLCYDYKNGELTEIANYFYTNSKIRVASIVPHDPQYSDRVNPFDPKYITDEAKLRQLTKNIFANLKKADNPTGGGSTGFFDKIPESTLAAIIWRLKCDFKEFCTLPHAVAICLTFDPLQIAEFICKNPYSKAIGKPLIDSTGSEKQLAGVAASLSLPMTDLALPTIFWVLSGNDVGLDINNPDNLTFLSIVNDPALEKVNAPFISLIVSVVLDQMRVRNRPVSFLMFDEGTTFTIDNISRIPATMRSFNIATIFSTQDKALAKETYGDTITNSLLANLSYQFIGKTNDPESVKYYKQISEEIEKKSTSKSYKEGSFLGDVRISESIRDTSKYKNQNFTGLKPGQFFLFADGKDKLYNFAQTKYERIKGTLKYPLTDDAIQANYEKIFLEAKNLIGQ